MLLPKRLPGARLTHRRLRGEGLGAGGGVLKGTTSLQLQFNPMLMMCVHPQAEQL